MKLTCSIDEVLAEAITASLPTSPPPLFKGGLGGSRPPMFPSRPREKTGRVEPFCAILCHLTGPPRNTSTPGAIAEDAGCVRERIAAAGAPTSRVRRLRQLQEDPPSAGDRDHVGRSRRPVGIVSRRRRQAVTRGDRVVVPIIPTTRRNTPGNQGLRPKGGGSDYSNDAAERGGTRSGWESYNDRVVRVVRFGGLYSARHLANDCEHNECVQEQRELGRDSTAARGRKGSK